MEETTAMEAHSVVPTHDDITFDTEETDNISEISHNIPTNKIATNKDLMMNKASMAKKEKSKLWLFNNSDEKQKLYAIIVVLACIVGILGGLLLSSDDPAPTLPPTAAPSALSTVTLRGKLEYLLQDYTPLDERTLYWLEEESTWTPDTHRGSFANTTEEEDYLWMERYAMGLLYFSTDGDKWKRNDDWISNDKPVCEWYSMEYNKCPGPMKHLVLYLNNLNGTLPSVLFELSELEKIHLARNDLNGSLPDSISKLSNLKFVDLASNWLNGSIPETITNMTNLESLYLSGNELTSSIPEEIGNMKNLKVLSWWGNYLTGTIPESIGNMTLLDDLSLSENSLSGTIPASIGGLTSLSRLSLHTNNLSGTIPETIAHMSNLQSLSLYENYHLEGSFPVLPETVRKCFLGSCFYDISNAVASRCIFFDSCE